ncbi:MAG: DUF3300 domain-containing protein [Wenzhouxiangella sp.]
MKATPLLLILTLVASLSLPRPGLSEAPVFTQAELDQMLAPVALYPDSVLSHVLIASTYPLEVIQAARWSASNSGMSGELAVELVADKPWDPSVMALVAFPSLLARMSEDIDWTYRLGDAFLFQEGQVIDTIQQLRERAWEHGHLRSNEQVRVVRETRYIAIEPARTRVVYVPVYDPRVVYGPWWWQAHPPVFWHHPHPRRSRVVVYWGPSYYVPPAFHFSAFHWPQRQVFVVHHHHHYHHFHPRATHRFHGHSSREVIHHSQARHWQHDPTHRRGVSYRQTPPDHRLVQQRAGTPVRQAPVRDSQRAWAGQQRQQTAISERSVTSDTRRQATAAAPQSRRLESQTSRTVAGSARATDNRGSRPAQSQRAGANTRSPVESDRSARPSSSTQRQAEASRSFGGDVAGARTAPRSVQSRSASPPARASEGRVVSSSPQSARSGVERPAASGRQPAQIQRSEPIRSRQPVSTQRPAQATRQAAPPVQRSAPTAPRQSAPSQSAPRQVAPRQAAPRAAPPARQSAPTQSRPAAVSPSRQSAGPSRSADRPRVRGEQQ